MSYIGKVNIDGSTNEYSVANTLYGICESAENDVNKIVVCDDFDALIIGVTINVKIINANTANNPTLNVNNTGAKLIKNNNGWMADSVIPFVYDGINWVIESGAIADNFATKTWVESKNYQDEITVNTKINAATGDKVTEAEMNTQINAAVADKITASEVDNKINTAVTSGSIKEELNKKQNKIDSSNKLPAAYISGLADVATSGNYNTLNNKPNLSTVATTGSYNDLTDKPTIPSGNVIKVLDTTCTIEKFGRITSIVGISDLTKVLNIYLTNGIPSWSGTDYYFGLLPSYYSTFSGSDEVFWQVTYVTTNGIEVLSNAMPINGVSIKVYYID